MKSDDIDITKEIEKIFSPERKIEDLFSSMCKAKWEKIPKEKKDLFIKKGVDYVNLENRDLENLYEGYKKFEDNKFNIIVLFLGIAFGIVGNLIANLVDRSFSYIGCKYNLFVIFFFIVICYLVYHFFIRKPKTYLKKKEETNELLNLIKEIENYRE